MSSFDSTENCLKYCAKFLFSNNLERKTVVKREGGLSKLACLKYSASFLVCLSRTKALHSLGGI